LLFCLFYEVKKSKNLRVTNWGILHNIYRKNI
jgi:hypothetical protein